MAAKGKHTATDLARLGGVSLRTVRYYVQQGLIDAPLGRGRGAHFTDRHLSQLLRARAMQAVGLDIAAIKQHADELERILEERGLTLESASRAWAAYALSTAELRQLIVSDDDDAEDDEDDDEDEDEELNAATAVRIPMAPGIELLVRHDLALPSPRRLVQIALIVRKAFGLK